MTPKGNRFHEDLQCCMGHPAVLVMYIRGDTAHGDVRVLLDMSLTPLKIRHVNNSPCFLQEERSQCLWQALERFIPDVRDRTDLTLTGTPLTHERFLNRHKGTYGAAISAASGSFPGPQTPIPGLYRWDRFSYSDSLHACMQWGCALAQGKHTRALVGSLCRALLRHCCEIKWSHLVCSDADPSCTIQLQAVGAIIMSRRDPVRPVG